MDPQKRKDNQSECLKQAASHGPYLWSSTDVRNALLWFPSAHRNSAMGQASDHIEERNTDEASGGKELLRCLLHSPGIHNSRRTKKIRKKRKRDSTSAKSDDNVLSSVFKGYYQLFLPRQHAATADASSQMQSTERESNKTQGYVNDNQPHNPDTADMSTAEMASSQLQHDLNSIISSRLRTNELYHAAPKRTNYAQCNSVPKELQMNMLIDEYMTDPTTAILRAYTSSLYDRYTALEGELKHRLLQKLMGLSKNNVKIQQVLLLFLLEPLRRLYVQQLLGVSNTNNGQTIEGQPESNEEFASNISLFPLLTSNITWSEIPVETIEEQCTLGPMQQLIDFIVQSAPSEQSTQAADTDILWWSLPSPLLCFISQLYFPFACGYIRYWINKAIVAHEQLYVLDSKISNNTSKPQSISLDGSNRSLFESSILRVCHFSQTSHRLKSLTNYMLLIREEKHTEACSDDDIVFQRKLACYAIKKRLNT